MRFFSTLFLGVAAAQSVSTVLSDIANIKSDTDSLTTAVQGVSIATIAQVLQASNALEATIKKATSDASALSSVSTADQVSVLTAVEGLYPSIISALQATVAQAGTFQQLGVSTVVTSTLQTLKSDSDAFAAALTAKATGPYVAIAQTLTQDIDAAFTSALNGQSPQAASLPSIPGAGSAPTTGSSGPAPTTGVYSAPCTEESAPVYSAPSAPVYSQPPVYSAPVYSQPPVYQTTPVAPVTPSAPVYSSPPVYSSAPVYSSPPCTETPSAPVYSAPSAPVYSAPSAPVYSAPSAPVYSASSAPVYTPPPVYSSAPSAPVYSSAPVYTSAYHGAAGHVAAKVGGAILAAAAVVVVV